MPNRILRERILKSGRVNKLSLPAEVFYRRLMSVIDDFGRFDAHPGILRAACYPRRLDEVTDADVQGWLGECCRAADCDGIPLVVVYAVHGESFLEVDDFRQQVRAKSSRYPDPPARAQQMLRTCVAGATQTSSACEADAQHMQAFAHLDGDGVEDGVVSVSGVVLSSSQSSELVQLAKGEPDAHGPGMVPVDPGGGPGKAQEPQPEPEDGPTPREIRVVYEHYLRAMGLSEGEYRLTPARRVRIRTRLTEFQPEALCDAIDSCRASPFHMGEMPKTNGACFNDLEKHILKSQEKVEDWLRRRNGKATARA